MLDTRKKKKSGKNLEKKESGKKFKKKRSRPESQEKKNQPRIQESCLVRHFLPCQTRFCLQEYHKNIQICFFRQESCVEGMAKES